MNIFLSFVSYFAFMRTTLHHPAVLGQAVALWVMSEWDVRNHHILLGSAIIFELS